MSHQPRPSRRAVLGVGAVGALAVSGAALASRLGGGPGPPTYAEIAADSPLVAAAEAARHRTGRSVIHTLRPAPTTVQIAGREIETWAYGDSIPGPLLRMHPGDRLRVGLDNALPDETTVHWHGLALRNDMDGVPGLTQAATAPGARFDYDFVAPHPGTYWYHPHVDVQLDTGLYGPLVVEDPDEPGRYDDEVVLMLDDWTDDIARSPKNILADFRAQGMGNMGDMGDMGGSGTTDAGAGSGGVSAARPLGADTGDVRYPLHLINAATSPTPYVVRSRPGARLRLRLINAGADTAYRFAIGGHRLTVTHTDGYPVEPVIVDTLVIGMGERYDVLVDVAAGTYPIVAVPEGKTDPAATALLTTSDGAVSSPRASARDVPELHKRLLDYADLASTPAVALSPSARTQPDRELSMSLAMVDGGRVWVINGHPYADRTPLRIEPGERVRITMRNQSSMFHPMHLHGHTFSLRNATATGLRKDTVNVLPGADTVIDLLADNPGQWLVHCHNLYHGELGMMTQLSYVERT